MKYYAIMFDEYDEYFMVDGKIENNHICSYYTSEVEATEVLIDKQTQRIKRMKSEIEKREKSLARNIKRLEGIGPDKPKED